MAKTKVKYQQDEIQDMIDNYMKSYQQHQLTMLKIEGAVEALKGMLKTEEGK
jgi:hypothetical protein|tara:strand:- start:153 stop:308 length:156 start_codon:yes stop_codon:yes gene_type:complete